MQLLLTRDINAHYLAMDSVDDEGWQADDVIGPAGSTVELLSRDNDMLEVTGFHNSPDTVAYVHVDDVKVTEALHSSDCVCNVCGDCPNCDNGSSGPVGTYCKRCHRTQR